MMKKLLFILTFLFSFVFVFAQNITLHKGETATGSHTQIILRKQATVTSGHSKITLTPGTVAYAFFHLSEQASVSAGVYDSAGKLYRTLFSGIIYRVGNHLIEWDGKDDDGNSITATGKIFKVVSNNLTATWDGVIANTGYYQTGDSAFHAYTFINNAVIVSGKMFCALGYAEGDPSVWWLKTADIQKKQGYVQPDVPAIMEQTNLVCADATNVYWGSLDPANATKDFVYATKISDNSLVTFSAGKTVPTTHTRTYSTADSSSALITGIAVQQSGNYLFVAHSAINELHVINKTTGATVQTLSYTTPTYLAVDGSDNLWMVSETNTVARYTVNSDGTLGSANLTLTGLVAPQAIAVNSTTVAICDAGSSQQVKAYSTTDGSSLWTLGTAGGYNNSPTVTNTKFFFSSAYKNYPTGVTFDTDGSFWVVDYGNNRMQHFSSNRTYIDNIAYLGRTYSATINPSDSSRLFANWLEYHVDYSNPIQQSWYLKNNWGYNIQSTSDFGNWMFKYVTTLSNGRTYALIPNDVTSKLQLIELTDSVRFIGDVTPTQFVYQLNQDGSLRGTSQSGNIMYFLKKDLTGFDASNNPVWAAADTITTVTVSNIRPTLGGAHVRKWDYTPDGHILTFQSNQGQFGSYKYHLGLLNTITGDYDVQISRSTDSLYTGNMPEDGWFDNGNHVGFAGSIAWMMDSLIFWGYNGEFYKASQTNTYNIFSKEGLFLYHFGVIGVEPGVYNLQAPAGMAGNAFSPSMIKIGNKDYLWHQDESYHSGLHRWTIDNIGSIKVQTIAAKLYIAPIINTIDLMADLPDSGTFTSIGSWTRTPNTNTTNTWDAFTGTKSYNKSKDLLVKFGLTGSDYTIVKDIGTVNSSNWTISGKISFPGSMPNSNNPGVGGKYMDILDANNKVIARLKDTVEFVNNVTTFLGNADTIVSYNGVKILMNFERPISIHADTSGVTFTYDTFSPVTSPLVDATADWQHPKYLRLWFWNTSGSVFGRIVDIQDFKLTYQ